MNQSTHKTDLQNRTFFVPFYPSNFNGKEKDCESGFHYYGARYYWSEVLTGWLSVDPLTDKYPAISPYAYCAWNPVRFVDYYGMDTLLFNSKGRYQECIPASGNPVGKMIKQDGTYVCFSFADPVNDVNSAKNNPNFKVQLIDDNTIEDLIKESNVEEYASKIKKLPCYTPLKLVIACIYLYLHSNAGTSMDDSQTLDYVCRINGMSDDILFVTNIEGEYTGHNGHNFGNFLWGASAQRLGVPLLVALAGAQWNNRFNSKDEYGGMWDSPDDQRSIYLGHTWARRNNP